VATIKNTEQLTLEATNLRTSKQNKYKIAAQT